MGLLLTAAGAVTSSDGLRMISWKNCATRVLILMMFGVMVFKAHHGPLAYRCWWRLRR